MTRYCHLVKLMVFSLVMHGKVWSCISYDILYKNMHLSISESKHSRIYLWLFIYVNFHYRLFPCSIEHETALKLWGDNNRSLDENWMSRKCKFGKYFLVKCCIVRRNKSHNPNPFPFIHDLLIDFEWFWHIIFGIFNTFFV